MKKTLLITLVSVAAIGAQAALITNEGTSVPSAGAIASHLTAAGTEGNREVSWRSSAVHSLSGQSFLSTTTDTAMGLTLKVRSTETWGNWTSDSFKIKVFEGEGASATELGSYAYDATEVAALPNTWVRFGFDSGIAMTNGTLYSFLIVNGAEDADHRINFARDSSSTGYAAGGEIRGNNLYDIANFDSDPWNPDVTVLSSGAVNLDQSGDLLFSVDVIPEPATLGLVALMGGGLFMARRMFKI